jgi:hypothetical protein
MDNSQNNGAIAPPAEEQVQRGEGAAGGSNPVEGNPSAGNAAPQAQTQTAQNTAQGGAATPLETDLRQRGDAEKQQAAEAKAAHETALANINRERRQKCLRSAQELIECLGSGMDLLSPEQVGQITEAAAAACSEPWDALRSFRERLRNLRDENPHASEADLREAVKGAVQAMIARSREQWQRGGTQRVAAESDTPRDVSRLPETHRTTCQDIPGPLPAECCGERNPRWSRCTITSVASGATCTRRSGTTTRISSGATTELCIRWHAARGGGIHGHIVASS